MLGSEGQTRKKNYMLLTCSYSHFKYRSMQPKIVRQAKFAVLQRDGSEITLEKEIFSHLEVRYAERRQKSIHLCTCNGETNIGQSQDSTFKNAYSNLVYIKKFDQHADLSIWVDKNGTVSLSSGKKLDHKARSSYRGNYQIDSRDLHFDDSLFYFVNTDHQLSILHVTQWNSGHGIGSCFTHNALVYDSRVATFALANNLLYVAFENCSVVLFTKRISTSTINLNAYWVQQKVLTFQKLDGAGLKFGTSDVPTAIKAGASFIAVAVFNEMTRVSKLMYAKRDLSRIKWKTVRPPKGTLSPICHIGIIRAHDKDYLIAGFKQGGLALFTIRDNVISGPLHSRGVCSQPINGMIDSFGILVVYGKNMITSLVLKLK
jgi:hypothetical protein